ncbi:hypothetical protein SAY86_030882 [Trapa natans]|uniref:Uncharacterized protein n=1 Tax=Trapa natans TaxID=22666 RepID=A0AAN7RHI4_TRANT|nr:hypothetical protein SAY86_030882 [Trapa natans]
MDKRSQEDPSAQQQRMISDHLTRKEGEERTQKKESGCLWIKIGRNQEEPDASHRYIHARASAATRRVASPKSLTG